MTYSDPTPTPRRRPSLRPAADRPLWGYNDHRQPIARVRLASTNARAYWESLRESLAEVISDLLALGEGTTVVVPDERNPLPADECSAEIDSMKEDLYILRGQVREARRAAHTAALDALVPDRLYERAGEVYRLVMSGAGNLYAKIWTTDGWEYAAGAVRDLRPAHRMSVERAKELSIKFGRCIRCGATLTADESVERGIGPVCITKI